MKLMKTSLAVAAVISLAVIGIGAAPANATETPMPLATTTVGLQFGGYNAQRAAENGYDVRTDAQGYQYAVPTGTPAGSLTGATTLYNPQTGAFKSPSGRMMPMNTVTSNCGSSTLTLYTATSGYTAYNLNGNFGAALTHTWKISVSASTGNQIVDRSGLPPFPGVSLSWGTNFSYSVHAHSGVRIDANVSTGVVETTLASCFVAGASDWIYA